MVVFMRGKFISYFDKVDRVYDKDGKGYSCISKIKLIPNKTKGKKEPSVILQFKEINEKKKLIIS